jgi:hypothetical protein
VDAVTAEQLLLHFDALVPLRPVRRLVDVAPVLVVDPAGRVIPMTHEVSRSLWLGSLFDAHLADLAIDWIAAGGGDVLAESCEQTWAELTERRAPHAVYWYDEVAARTRSRDRVLALA